VDNLQLVDAHSMDQSGSRYKDALKVNMTQCGLDPSTLTGSLIMEDTLL